MSGGVAASPPETIRFLVVTVAPGRASVPDDLVPWVTNALQAAGHEVVRNSIVNREKAFIVQLMRNVASYNEADVVLLIGGVGLGPRDFTCEAVEEIAERRMEGFGEAFRSMLESTTSGHAAARVSLARAAAGVFNKCVVFALPRQRIAVQSALRSLILPLAREAVDLAYGKPWWVAVPPPNGSKAP